jgi:hypothetical protein
LAQILRFFIVPVAVSSPLETGLLVIYTSNTVVLPPEHILRRKACA